MSGFHNMYCREQSIKSMHFIEPCTISGIHTVTFCFKCLRHYGCWHITSVGNALSDNEVKLPLMLVSYSYQLVTRFLTHTSGHKVSHTLQFVTWFSTSHCYNIWFRTLHQLVTWFLTSHQIVTCFFPTPNGHLVSQPNWLVTRLYLKLLGRVISCLTIVGHVFSAHAIWSYGFFHPHQCVTCFLSHTKWSCCFLTHQLIT